MKSDEIVLINCCGRGDKDMITVRVGRRRCGTSAKIGKRVSERALALVLDTVAFAPLHCSWNLFTVIFTCSGCCCVDSSSLLQVAKALGHEVDMSSEGQEMGRENKKQKI